MPEPRLPALLAIPRVGAAAYDPRWLDVEHSLGLALPASYMAIVEQFGTSPWCQRALKTSQQWALENQPF